MYVVVASRQGHHARVIDQVTLSRGQNLTWGSLTLESFTENRTSIGVALDVGLARS